VGVGKGDITSSNGVIENLTEALRDPKLRKGGNLQETLAEVIRDSSNEELAGIKPQMISTLPLLVDFPEDTPRRVKKAKWNQFKAILGMSFLSFKTY